MSRVARAACATLAPLFAVGSALAPVAPDAGEVATKMEDALVAHWTFDGDARDASGMGNHGRSHSVDFSAPGRDGRPGGAARFNGVNACIEVPPSESFSFAEGEFTVAAWIRLEEAPDDVPGDLAGQFDSAARRGWSLGIKGTGSGYNGPGDMRRVSFGIDNAVESKWEDCGQLWPGNTFAGCLTVYKGSLYAGLADAPKPEDACRVMRYAGGQKWEDCGRPSPNLRVPSVFSMTVHKGELYGGTGTVDWVVVEPGKTEFGRVYRYAGGKEWIDCGQPCETYRIHALASFKGDLYAQTDDLRGGRGKRHLFRYLGGQEWEDCDSAMNGILALSLTAHNGKLFAGMGDPGEILRYDGGKVWTSLGVPARSEQVHTMDVFRGLLHAGVWPEGDVWRLENGAQWIQCGRLGEASGFDGERRGAINEINDLTVYNGKLYAGVIPKGEVYRYEEGDRWTLMRRLVTNPDHDPNDIDSWSRVSCLTEFGGRLYAGTSTCRGGAQEAAHGEYGRVYSFMAGQCISYDRDLGAGWRHIAAVRERGRLRLYVDGKLVCESEPFAAKDYNLSNDTPLRIGFGETDYFEGAMDEMRVYRRALGAAEIARLARPSSK